MRVLFAIRSVSHFSYVSSIVENLEKNGHEVDLLFDKYWSLRHGSEIFKIERSMNFEWMVKRSSWRKLIFPIREFRSFANYTRRKTGSKFYVRRWNGYLLKGLRTISWYGRRLISKIPDQWFDRIEKMVPSDKGVVCDLINRCPDVLVVTPMNMRFSEEVEYVKAAKNLGIPTVLMVCSWDNLTTKGTFHAMPDRVLVWNEMQKKEAVELHGVPTERIFITGAPFFDKWFDCDYAEPREAFCGRFGINPEMSYIVYLGSSKNITGDERWLVEKIVKKAPSYVVARPHPANKFKANWAINFESSVPETEEEKRDFYNLIYHSLYVTGVNTSAMLDAMIIGKSVFPIRVEKYKETQSDADHFKPLQNIKFVDRDSFIKEYIRPYGKPAGEVAEQRIEEML